MPSAHEYSTLMLIKDAAHLTELDREEVSVLVQRRLIAVDTDDGAVRTTALGDRLLEILARLSSTLQSL